MRTGFRPQGESLPDLHCRRIFHLHSDQSRPTGFRPSRQFCHYFTAVGSYADQHKYQEAIKELRLALQIGPDEPFPHLNLSNIYRMMNGDRSKAVEAFRKVVEVDPRPLPPLQSGLRR